jgi:hypothetical protein
MPEEMVNMLVHDATKYDKNKRKKKNKKKKKAYRIKRYL